MIELYFHIYKRKKNVMVIL
uniref:Uncharacterized protein n=1 Tax=Anguilla anguilla TaxID=7936 RepID=A0A0E9PP28_ANGAN